MKPSVLYIESYFQKWHNQVLYLSWRKGSCSFERTKGKWNASNIGDNVGFYVTSPIKRIIGFGKINEKFIDEKLIWPDEKLFNISIYKYSIKFNVYYLIGDWQKGIDKLTTHRPHMTHTSKNILIFSQCVQCVICVKHSNHLTSRNWRPIINLSKSCCKCLCSLDRYRIHFVKLDCYHGRVPTIHMDSLSIFITPLAVA